MIYKAGSLIYRLLIRLLAPFHFKAKASFNGRKGWEERLKSFKAAHTDKKIIWMHCASTGEFEQGRSLIEELKEKNPSSRILLTFFSPSGYEAKKNYPLADHIDYLPFDSKNNARTFLDILNPDLAFFVKYEFWPYYLEEIGKREIKLFLVSGIFRENQLFFKYPKTSKILSAFRHFYLQDHFSAQLLEKIGYKNSSVTGDSRLDRVITVRDTAFTDRIIGDFTNKKTIVAGSTWSADQHLLIEYIRREADWKLMLIPHELDNKKLQEIRTQLKDIAFAFYSEDPNQEALNKAQVLVVDTMGMLSKLYRFGCICYIGGGFGKGIHNILEAAVYLKPVFFGPNHKKFKEAKDLIDLEVAYSISNYNELENIIKTVTKAAESKKTEKNALHYINTNAGAAKKIIQSLEI